MQYLNSYDFAARICLTQGTFSVKLNAGYLIEPCKYVKAKRGASAAYWSEGRVDDFIEGIVKRAKGETLKGRGDRLVDGFGLDPNTLKKIIKQHETKDDPVIDYHHLTLSKLAKIGVR